MICGLVVSKIYKHEFSTFLQNLSRICKNGHNFCILTRMKKFFIWKIIYSKSYIQIQPGNPVKHFQNPQKPNRTKDTGLLRYRGGKMEKNSNLLVAHHLLGAPLVAEKNWFRIFFLEKMFKIWYVIWPGSLKYFFKISSHSWTWTKS